MTLIDRILQILTRASGPMTARDVSRNISLEGSVVADHEVVEALRNLMRDGRVTFDKGARYHLASRNTTSEFSALPAPKSPNRNFASPRETPIVTPRPPAPKAAIKSDPVVEQLAKARESLLDLSLHNRMLNYRPTKRTSIRVIDEHLAQVWRLIVDKEKQLEFLARDEHENFDKGTGTFPGAEQDDDDGETFDLPNSLADRTESAGDPLASRYTDRYLQTNLEGD